MAVQRLSLTQIRANILEILGYSTSANAPWSLDSTLDLRINQYGQRLPMRLNSMARQLNLPTPVRLDCWRTTADSSNSTTAAIQVAIGSATVYMPVDLDAAISYYDLDNKRPIYPLEGAYRYEIEDLVNSPPGLPKYIEVGGYVTEGSNWRRQATIYPAPISTYTYSLRLEYWRLPTSMPGEDPNYEYPDIDPKYESLFVFGPVTDLTRSTGQEFDRYAAIEKEMLVEMLSTARAI